MKKETNKTAPLTVLIMCYNHEDVLKRSFESVVQQTIFNNINVIISDDSSTDNTYDVAKKIARPYENVTVRKNAKNLGIMKHYHHVLNSIKTEYVAILEADDQWINPEKLENQIKFFERFNFVNLVFSGYTVKYDYTHENTDCTSLLGSGRNGFYFFEDLLNGNPVASFTNCMYKTASLTQIFSLDVVNKGYDWLVNLCLADRSPIGYLAGNHAEYFVHKNGTWSKLTENEKKNKIVETLEALIPHVSENNKAMVDMKIQSITHMEGA